MVEIALKKPDLYRLTKHKVDFKTPIIWVRVVDVLKAFNLLTRVQWSGDTEPTPWEHSLFIPTSGYLETGLLEPVLWQTIQWIEVNTVEERRIGRLVLPKRIDHKVLASLNL